jgi:hypothetical protein
MDSTARQEVSERMKRYWARRRAARNGNQGNPEEAPKQESKPDDRLDVSEMAAGASAELTFAAGFPILAG